MVLVLPSVMTGTAELGLLVQFGHERLFNFQRTIGRAILRGCPFSSGWDFAKQSQSRNRTFLSKRQNSRQVVLSGILFLVTGFALWRLEFKNSCER